MLVDKANGHLSRTPVGDIDGEGRCTAAVFPIDKVVKIEDPKGLFGDGFRRPKVKVGNLPTGKALWYGISEKRFDRDWFGRDPLGKDLQADGDKKDEQGDYREGRLDNSHGGQGKQKDGGRQAKPFSAGRGRL